jgi:hypothetical protein
VLMAVMAIMISALNLRLRSVALRVLDERAPRALTTSGSPCSGDLHILIVHLQSAKWTYVLTPLTNPI